MRDTEQYLRFADERARPFPFRLIFVVARLPAEICGR